MMHSGINSNSNSNEQELFSFLAHQKTCSYISAEENSLVKTKKPNLSIESLVSDIIHHRQQYSVGQPEISDQEYDQLEQRLAQLSPNHPLLNQVGAVPAANLEKAAHQTPMLSLRKVYSIDELDSWRNSNPVVATFKIDGNSMSLIYEYGQFVQAKTRGDGKLGEDVTEKLRWILAHQDLLEITQTAQIPALEIRGELYCSKTKFKELKNEMIQRGLDAPTSKRNIVAGVLTRKSHSDLARFFDFLCFDILSETLSFEQELDKVAWMKSTGFTSPPHQLIETRSHCEQFISEAEEFKKDPDSQFEIDGVVFSFNQTSLHQKLGATSHHPRYRMAYKWHSYTAKTTLAAIEWNTSRSGLVIPVGILDPVHMPPGNALISRLSLHNASHIIKHNLKPGSEVEIIRAGDIIPYLSKNIRTSFGPPVLPKSCPSCNATLEFQSESLTPSKKQQNLDFLQLVCPNISCPHQLLKSLRHWCSVLDIADLGEQRLLSFIQAKLVTEISDLYLLSPEQLISLDGYKQTITDKLIRHIQGSKNCSSEKFLTALGLPGLGKEIAAAIAKYFNGAKKFIHLSNTDHQILASIEISEGRTVGAKRAENILSALFKNQTAILRLHELIQPSYTAETKIITKQPMDHFSVVITGSFSVPRPKLSSFVKSLGAQVSDSYSKKTNLLLIADKNSTSSKAKKARENDSCTLWDEDDFKDFISEQNIPWPFEETGNPTQD